jgi:metallophosphoesterase superfamily enzyme
MVEFVGKCLYVESLNGKRILAVGDLHLGYEESLNFSGVFVSRQLFKEIIGDLEEIFRVLEKEEKKVDEVVLLGDVRHEFGRLGRQERSDSDKLFDFFEKRGVRVVIARGNHDTIIEPLARARGIEIVDVYRVDEIAFVHGNKDWKELHEKM